MTYLDIYAIGGNESSTIVAQIGLALLVVAVLLVILDFVFGIPIYRTKHNVNEPQAPAQEASAQQAPAQEAPAQEAPAQETPVQPSPVEPSNNTGSFTNKEPFTNDLPYQLNKESLNLSPDLDYNDFLQKMSLDQDVVKQHNQYVSDRNKVTSTASFAPSRSDTQDIVTRWGLTGRSAYVAVDPSARNVPSQDPEQGSKPVRLQWK